jgi:hypothetical protein
MYPEKLNIEPTKRSPWIVFEPGRIFVMGRAIIDNPSIFFETPIKWVSAFSKEWTGKTKIDLGFEYINTGSTKWLYLLLRELAEMNNMPVNAEVKWYYENGDDDMCELGYILRSLVDCKFTIVEVEEMNDNVYQDFLNNK